MTAVVSLRTPLGAECARLAETLVRWLESGVRPDDLFADDVFCDLSLPQWRVQAVGAAPVFEIRADGHPGPGRVRIEALDPTSRGFLIQFEERWDAQGQSWYCREMIHCVVLADRIVELFVYCTGDWNADAQRRHAEQVHLVRS